MALPNSNITPGSPPLLWSNLNDAFIKINENFDSLAAGSGGGGAVNFNTLDTNVSPTTDNLYKLGTDENRWKSLYLSEYSAVAGSESNGLWISEAQIKGIGSIIDLPAGSTVNGSLIIDPAKTAFNRISVTGQSDVIADNISDTLTLIAGSSISITTNAGNDSITINNTGVKSLIAGTGITVDTSTGDVTVTNDGVRTITAGTEVIGRSAGIGISVSGTNDLTITNTGVIDIQSGSPSTLTVVKNSITGVITLSSVGGPAYRYISVSGQTTIDSINPESTLTFESGYGIVLTTSAPAKKLTIGLNQRIDIIGSVFADDSSTLVDGVYGKLVGPVETPDIILSNADIHLGNNAGSINQSAYAIAIGENAAQYSQSSNAIAIGRNTAQGYGPDVTATYVSDSVLNLVVSDTTGIAEGMRIIGDGYGNNTHVVTVVDGSTLVMSTPADSTPPPGTVFTFSGYQSGNAIAIGIAAGSIGQNGASVAIGMNAGELGQQETSVAVGHYAGQTLQGSQSVAIGSNAGNEKQGTNSVAVGRGAGSFQQGNNAIAIGADDVGYQQGNFSIAIGYQAGWADSTPIGQNAVAIGHKAAYGSAVANSITLNASGNDLSAVEAGLFVNPVREDTANISQIVFYNTTTKELTYARTNSVQVTVIPDGTTITINSDITDVAKQNNTQGAGTLTINAPTGTPVDCQRLTLRIKSANIQSLSWDPIFVQGSDIPLPATTTGASKYDYYGFMYNSETSKWDFVSNVNGF